jgi:hypothetical protein
VEAANHNRDPCFPKRSCDIKGARILVRLNSDEPNHAEITVAPEAGEESWQVNARVGLVDSHNIDGDVRSKNLALRGIGCDTVYCGKRI